MESGMSQYFPNFIVIVIVMQLKRTIVIRIIAINTHFISESYVFINEKKCSFSIHNLTSDETSRQSNNSNSHLAG